jgi:hypothetical protein
MMHGTYCVEVGILGRVDMSYPRIPRSALQPAVVEMLFNITLQTTDIVLYLAKKLQSWLASEPCAPFPFRCQRLKQHPISGTLPVAVPSTAIGTVQFPRFLSPMKGQTKLSILV